MRTHATKDIGLLMALSEKIATLQVPSAEWHKAQADREQVLKRLSLQRSSGQWIPISERLPDEDGRLWVVLTDALSNWKITGYYPLFEYYHFDNGWATDDNITHWLDVELPAIPAPKVSNVPKMR